MDQQVFNQGVRPGSVTTEHEVMVLLCYLMREIGRPVTYEQLSQSLMSQQLVNYFEFAGAMAALEKSGHIVADGSCWCLAPLGEKTAEAFERDLPVAVRERAVAALEKILIQMKRQQENKVFIDKREDGYTITLTITDIGSDLLSVSMFLPTMEECKAVRRRFLNDPTFVYKGVFAMLTGDMESIGELIPGKQDLFDE